MTSLNDRQQQTERYIFRMFRFYCMIFILCSVIVYSVACSTNFGLKNTLGVSCLIYSCKCAAPILRLKNTFDEWK